jgi:hypothetical protein
MAIVPVDVQRGVCEYHHDSYQQIRVSDLKNTEAREEVVY